MFMHSSVYSSGCSSTWTAVSARGYNIIAAKQKQIPDPDRKFLPQIRKAGTQEDRAEEHLLFAQNNYANLFLFSWVPHS